MSLSSDSPPPPKGIAFEIEDLTHLSHWAASRHLRMVVELDHWVEGDEYEEVLAFYEQDSALRGWTIWRASDYFVLEPMNGPAFRSLCLGDLMQELTPLRP